MMTTGYQLLPTDHVPIKAWTNGVPFEPEAEAQLRRVAALPFIHQWIAVMPDVHAGIGATVGSVIACTRAVIPAAVGVDIGCGMMAVKTSLSASDLPDELRALRLANAMRVNQLGTLGAGNHFIELCLDEAGAVWVMLHSGSRGAGNRIGSYFIERAKAEMRRWFVNLPDEDLAYLPAGSELFDDYLHAVEWAQRY